MKLNKKLFHKKADDSFNVLSKKFQDYSDTLVTEFSEKHQGSIRWLEKKGIKVDEALEKGGRGAATGLAASLVLLSSGQMPTKDLEAQKNTVTTTTEVNKIVSETISRQDTSQALVNAFQADQIKNQRSLTSESESKLIEQVSKITGIKVSTELEGNRLNTNIGKIGLEQHLPRYPGETINDHFDSGLVANIYAKSGLTRNKGAFGHYADSKYSLSKEAVEMEKYYLVVQTFDIPGWNRQKWEWYKHRKMLVVNTENGRAVVGSLGDSGPAKWTGKSFGGSPELMDHLQMYRGSRNAKVLIFFIDTSQTDPKLGPI